MMLRSLLALFVFVLASCGGGGGLTSDGGVSGTGISALTGTVTAIVGSDGDLAGVRVAITGTDLVTSTDAQGVFELRGEFEGPLTVTFERAADGLAAVLDVQVPAGGTITLADVVLDVPSGAARPARRSVDFAGRVDAVDCAAQRLFVVSRFASERVVFAVQLDRTGLRDESGRAVACAELVAGGDVAVTGIVLQDGSIADGVVTVVRPTPTRTRPARTSTPGRTPAVRPSVAPTVRPEPTGTASAARPTSTAGTHRPTPTRVPVEPTATRAPVAPTATREAPRPTPTPTRIRPSPTPPRG